MQIKLIPNENGIPEWIAIELQGAFEFNADMSGKSIGHLAWMQDGTVGFVIGHQYLEGKLTDLQRPFLVINKASLRGMNGVSATEHTFNSGDQITASTLPKTSIKRCDIMGVIRRKILFNTRPKPIVPRHDHK
uniref:Uncharacterized protein n=1 Tax=Ditylenchus dipsaci TaxID=166011 RepID=A0A915E026_9BILA